MMNTPDKKDLVQMTEDFRNSIIEWIVDNVKKRRGQRLGFASSINIMPSEEDVISELAEAVWFDNKKNTLMVVVRDINDNNFESHPANLFSVDLLIAISDKFKVND